MVAFARDALSKLCSDDQLALLDSIDRLRLQGINNYISLPQIIVCGDQSSGKSSVLEAISGVSFPIKSNLCTRFPTELVLRRASHISASVSIVPDESRTDSEKKALRGFREVLSDFDDLPKLVESAKVEMGITAHGRAFAKDILRVEITGPNHPHLTIVDLPGLIHSETKNQTSSDVELIQDIVWSYMKEPRCIILAVVSAKNDFANQVVLKLARAADTSGSRTLGVITKPDTLTPGSESEALYMSLARNLEVEFRHGWHVLKNMDSEKGSWSLSQRDAKEAEFFNSGVWTELPVRSRGIDELRRRLSKVLLGQIASELPSLMVEINDKFESCQYQLEKLGEPRSSPQEQRLYLVQLSQTFQALVKASASGNYNDPFFGDAKTESGYQRRIRAVVQNLNANFASEMSSRGHYQEVVDEDGELGATALWAIDPSGSRTVTRVRRDDFISHIEHLMSRTRGCELPGTFSPMIVTDLFLEQSRPWEGIVRSHVEGVWQAASNFISSVVVHAADASTAKALRHEVFEPALKGILNGMCEKTSELLGHLQKAHPMTYSQYFTEALQKIRREPRKKDVDAILRRFFGNVGKEVYLEGEYNLQALADRLRGLTEPDVKRSAASEALDYLNGYYKVALERFIDDVAVEVIEARLISLLENILSPLSVYQMPADQVARIAGESEETRTQREQLSKQLEVLRSGLETCRRFAGFRISGDFIFVSAHDYNSSSGLGREAEPGSDADPQQESSTVRSMSPAPEPAAA